MNTRRPALFFLLTALGLAAWAVVVYRHEPDPGPRGPALSVERPERDLGALPGMQTHDVAFRLDNGGDRPCRVLGAPFT